MKKHIVMAFTSLALASNLAAFEGVKMEHCFRPAFQKKLKRVKSVELRSFNSIGRNQNPKKKVIFIDWRKLYWGKLSDLIYSEEETYIDDVQGIAGCSEEQTSSLLNTEETISFAKELRQELKAFTKQYGLKIVWRKKSPDITDGTAVFLEYWDRGFSQEDQSKVMPFTELCALTVKEASAKASNTKGENGQHLPSKGGSSKHISLKSLLLRKEA